MIKKLIILSLSLSIVLVSGCRSGVVHNIDDAAIVTSVDKYTTKDVKKAIMRAGGSLGWIMKPNGSDKMTATLTLRKHVAVVDISYNKKTYSIRYKDSQNLDYDGTNIHSNYNGWIQRLNSAIQNQLNLL